MKKKDLEIFRKQLKLNGAIVIPRMVSAYINKENEELIFQKQINIEMLEDTEKEVYLKNFKKIITGGIDQKVFELDVEQDTTFAQVMNASISSTSEEEFNNTCNHILSKILENYTYDTDIIVNIGALGFSTETDHLPFIICTINSAKLEDRKLLCDLNRQDISLERGLDPVINIKSPTDGFLFPLYEDYSTNVNKVICYSGKTNKTNVAFVQEVLECKVKLTEKEEKEIFSEVIKKVVGANINPTSLHDFYSEILRRFETEEDIEYRTINASILETVLNVVNIPFEVDIAATITELTEVENYSFFVDNVVPAFDKKSMCVRNGSTEIKIAPQGLTKMQQIRKEDGKVYMLIELEEGMEVAGFDILTENQIPQ